MNHIKLYEEFGQEPEIDFTKIDSIEFDGVDHSDAPDYSDAFIISCDIDGRPATEEELDIINNDDEFRFGEIEKHVY
jgi:hypothetical protein